MKPAVVILSLLLLAGCGGKPTPPLEVIAVEVPQGNVGYPYRLQLTATGGVPPYKWSMSEGSDLPLGLTLNADTGEISGVPLAEAGGYDGQAKKWQFTVEVRDSAE